MKFINIKGADQLVQELTLPLAEIELNIQELEAHKEELQTKLDSGGKKFSLDFLKLNKTTQSDLDLVNRALKAAVEERERIIKSNYKKAYTGAEKIIFQHMGEVRKTKMNENKRMIEKIHEIREIFKELETFDRSVESELNAFLKAVEKFVSDEPITANNINTPRSMLLSRIDTYGSYSRNELAFIELFKESDYGINGLIKRNFEPKHSEKESDEKYGIVTPTPVKL